MERRNFKVAPRNKRSQSTRISCCVVTNDSAVLPASPLGTKIAAGLFRNVSEHITSQHHQQRSPKPRPQTKQLSCTQYLSAPWSPQAHWSDKSSYILDGGDTSLFATSSRLHLTLPRVKRPPVRMKQPINWWSSYSNTVSCLHEVQTT